MGKTWCSRRHSRTRTFGGSRRKEHKICHRATYSFVDNRGLKWKACNLYSFATTIQFLKRTPCVPRPCAAEVISKFRSKKRRHNESFETAPYPCISSVNQGILSTIWSDSLSDSLSLCLLKLKMTVYTLNNPLLVPLLLKSVSIVSEVGMFQRNRFFVTWMAKTANLTLVKVW